MLWLNAHYLTAFSSNMVYTIKEVIRIYTHPLKQGHHPRIVVESISRVNAYRKAKAYWLMMGYAVPNIIDVIQFQKDSGQGNRPTVRMKTKIISINNQRMSSLEIAALTGKPHNDVMKAIRKMEPAWVKIAQGKFSLGPLQRP